MATAYGICTILDVPYEAAIEQTIATLKAEGFGALTEIDVKATLKQKLNAESRRYVILGSCNPPPAYRAFQAELGLLMPWPCNVIVYASDEGRTVVSIGNPQAMLSEAGSAPLQDLATKARARLTQVIKKLQAV